MTNDFDVKEEEEMVSFRIDTDVLEDIDKVRNNDGRASRSSTFRKMVKLGLNSYFDTEKKFGMC